MPYNLTGRVRFGLALLLASLAALAPFNIDMYLPSFPDIAADLNTSASWVQLSLTACLIGLAVGQLVIGPISDAHGRKVPILVGMGLFVAASVVCALAPNIATLVVGRFLQGFTASAGIVLSRAVARDLFSGRDLTQFFSLLMAINATAPLIAPVAGGALLLLPSASWHITFYALAAIGLGIVVIVALRLRETWPPAMRIPASPAAMGRTMIELLRDRIFLGYSLVIGFVHGGTFAYVAGTPFVYQGIYGVSPQVFSVLFGINGIAIILGSFLIGRLSDRMPVKRLLRLAVTASTMATGGIFVTTLFNGPLAALVVLLFGYMTAMGMVMTSSFSLALEGQGDRAGTASAVMGALPLVIGSIVAPLVGIDESTAVPMGAVLFGTSAVGFVAFFKLAARERATVTAAR